MVHEQKVETLLVDHQGRRVRIARKYRQMVAKVADCIRLRRGGPLCAERAAWLVTDGAALRAVVLYINSTSPPEKGSFGRATYCLLAGDAECNLVGEGVSRGATGTTRVLDLVTRREYLGGFVNGDLDTRSDVLSIAAHGHESAGGTAGLRGE